LRPFIGRFWISACGTVPAIWLRAVSSTRLSATTVTAVSMPAISREIEISNAEPALSINVRAWSSNPWRFAFSSYGPTFKYAKRNRPSASVMASTVTFVSVWRTLTVAPGTAAPCGSSTRPLMAA
jgi:hypothetical protein